MVPTLCRTLGVKGHRPVVGTWDSLMHSSPLPQGGPVLASAWVGERAASPSAPSAMAPAPMTLSPHPASRELVRRMGCPLVCGSAQPTYDFWTIPA